MLFTVVVVSAISVITAGLANIAYKQITLSSLAKDSQIATVWADTANECALFFEQVAIKHLLGQDSSETSWKCGGIEFNIDWKQMSLSDYNDGNYKYELEPSDNYKELKNPCFEFEVNSINDGTKNVTIISSGFNICDTNTIRTVQRTYEINYNQKYEPGNE